uniref:SH3 domain-containing protein n=1 Tax=Catharus ustulatus TaxID=91951 RepID=A0A8C3UJW7_CATUS
MLLPVLSQLCPWCFEGIAMQQRKAGKLNRCLEIMKLLEKYSQELLKMDVKISQGEEVNQFFRAQTQDLDPSFPENSVVIMPSVFRREKSPQPLSITLPQASQSYRCIEAFKTKDTKNKPFTAVKIGVFFLSVGWWLVENADKQIAWFPASYLEELDACEDIQPALSSLYFVVQPYEAQKADELSLHQGVVVEVLRRSHHGWWLIRGLLAVPARVGCLSLPGDAFPVLTPLSSLAEPEVATGVPKVPARPSTQEILQRCSTVTKRALQPSAPRPGLPGDTHPSVPREGTHTPVCLRRGHTRTQP